MKKTFREWLLNENHRGAIRDLADDVRRDADFPNSNDLETLREHLIIRGACREAEDALKRTWKVWRKKYAS